MSRGPPAPAPAVSTCGSKSRRQLCTDTHQWQRATPNAVTATIYFSSALHFPICTHTSTAQQHTSTAAHQHSSSAAHHHPHQHTSTPTHQHTTPQHTRPQPPQQQHQQHTTAKQQKHQPTNQPTNQQVSDCAVFLFSHELTSWLDPAVGP